MVARVSESSPTVVVGASLGIGIDLGRHRCFAGTALHSPGEPLPLSLQDDGLLIRWIGAGRPQRVTERILDLAGREQEEAVRFVGLVASQIKKGLDSNQDKFSADQASIGAVAIPASFGPQGRRAVVEGFQRSGIELGSENLIERPIAALAGWFAHREQISGHSPRDPVLLIDNDGGELSAVVAAPLTRRLLACMPLSSGPTDDPGWVVERLKDLIATAAGMLHREGIIRETDWPTLSAALPQVVVTGSGHNHPDIASLIHSLLPAADVMPDPLVVDPSHCVVLGLQHLEQFAKWRACWPTSEILISEPDAEPGDQVIVVNRGQVLSRQDECYVVKPGAQLSFGTMSHPLRLRSGSVRASALTVPPSAGPLPLLRLLPDGRLSIRGAKGVRPLTVQLNWPCPGTQNQEMKLSTVGRRAATLIP